MKKLVVTFLTLLTCGAVYALPVGNPSEASLFTNGLLWGTYCCDPCDPCFSWCEAWSVRAGFYGDYVFNRHLEIDSGDHHNGADIERTEIYTNAGYLALNFCDRVDLFGTVGATNLHIRTNATAWSSLTSLESELDFETKFSWSVGGRASVWECGCLTLGVEGQYFQTSPDVDYFLEYAGGTLTYFNDGNGACYSEWQVGLGVAYRLSTSCPTFAMVPYAAIKWSGAKLKLNDFTFTGFDEAGDPVTYVLEDLDAKKHWGYAIGMSFTMCDLIGVAVEGRFADEKALYVNGQIRF